MVVQDVLDLVAPSLSFMASSYLAPQTPGATNPNITYLSPRDEEGRQQLVYCKGFVTKSGKILGDPAQATAADPLVGLGPWDWMVATDVWIRQKLTERVWTNLATGKLESMSGDGVRRLPRRISYDPSGLATFQWTMSRPETDYLIVDPPTPATGPYPLITKNTDAGVRCTFRGPYPGAAINDLPAGEDWIEDYEWSGKPNSAGVMTYGGQEEVLHRRGYGRYQWSFSPSDGQGGYLKPTSVSTQTKIMPLPPGLKPIQYVF